MSDTERMVGQALVNVRGEKVGKIDELVGRGEGEDQTWACVKYGLLGARSTYVPLEHAVEEDGHVRVPYETEIIRQAPDVTLEDGRISEADAEQLHRHFGLEPLHTPVQETDDHDEELPREPRDAIPPAMEEGEDSPLTKRRRERARELGVPEHD
ncbi:MAG TPA: hypothetical protein VFP55_12320 [Solirubrobacteraceae bacterium]|nr:hypothetical protein [Solirubrobacteraceae bacterium]